MHLFIYIIFAECFSSQFRLKVYTGSFMGAPFCLSSVVCKTMIKQIKSNNNNSPIRNSMATPYTKTPHKNQAKIPAIPVSLVNFGICTETKKIKQSFQVFSKDDHNAFCHKAFMITHKSNDQLDSIHTYRAVFGTFLFICKLTVLFMQTDNSNIIET